MPQPFAYEGVVGASGTARQASGRARAGADPPAPALCPNPRSYGIPSFHPKKRGPRDSSKEPNFSEQTPPGSSSKSLHGWPGAPLLRPRPQAPGPGLPKFSQMNSTLRGNKRSAQEGRCSVTSCSPASLGARHLAEWRTRLIRFNYISFKFKNPLKERIALAASRCLPTHRGNHGLLCLNYVTLPWAVAREPGYREGTGPTAD